MVTKAEKTEPTERQSIVTCRTTVKMNAMFDKRAAVLTMMCVFLCVRYVYTLVCALRVHTRVRYVYTHVWALSVADSYLQTGL